MIGDAVLPPNATVKSNTMPIGKISSISLRYITIKTFDNMIILIPNREYLKLQTQGISEIPSQSVMLKIQLIISQKLDLKDVFDIVEGVLSNMPRIMKSNRPKIHCIDSKDKEFIVQIQIFINDPENGISNIIQEAQEKIVAELEPSNVVKFILPLSGEVVQLKRYSNAA